MKIFGKASLSDFLGDRVVYRKLIPSDSGLSSLEDLRASLGLQPGQIPRKTEQVYAKVIVHMLNQAHSLSAANTAIERLLYIGDTRMLDGSAFINLCQAGGWPGLAFIGSENGKPAAFEIVMESGQQIYLSNRWSSLVEQVETGFIRYAEAHGFPFDESTAVVIDIDKTALGARGRNDKVIDQARVQAVEETVSGLLRDSFDPQVFRTVYNQLNQPEFHPFTADNQDYLAYTCLIIGSGLYQLQALMDEVRSGRLASFEQFIYQVDSRSKELPPDLGRIHYEIMQNVRNGDPTPFKEFRRKEFLSTVKKMGCLDDQANVDQLLAEEITVTQEVATLAGFCDARGCLLFGLSDKPDEASTPTPELAGQGYLPLHRILTHVVGSGAGIQSPG